MSFKMIDYSKVDEVLKNTPNISWGDFQKTDAFKSSPMSSYSFFVHRKKIRGGKGVSSDSVNLRALGLGNKKKKRAYTKLVELIKANPTLSYAKLNKQFGPLKISNPFFYKVRKNILNTTTTEQTQTRHYSRSDNRLLVKVFEKDASGVTQEARQLLLEFISALNDRKLADLTLSIEEFPEHKLRVFSHK